MKACLLNDVPGPVTVDVNTLFLSHEKIWIVAGGGTNNSSKVITLVEVTCSLTRYNYPLLPYKTFVLNQSVIPSAAATVEIGTYYVNIEDPIK